MIDSLVVSVNCAVDTVKTALAGRAQVADQRIEVRYFQRRIRLVEKTCVVCGARFEATARRLYCSNSCQQKVSYSRHREKRLAEQRERYRTRKGAGRAPQEGRPARRRTDARGGP